MKAVIRVAAALIFAASSTSAQAVSAADDTSTLRTLAERIAVGYGGGQTDVELDPGRVGTLPIALAVPAGATVIGTLVRRPKGPDEYLTYRYTQYEVFLNSAQQPSALLDALAASAAAAGYTVTPMPGVPSGGFSVSDLASQRLFCKAGDRHSIIARATRVGTETQASVTISEPLASNPPAGGTPCARTRVLMTGDTTPLPVIAPIEGVQLQRRSSSSGNGYSEQTVAVLTALEPAAVLGAWSRQLTSTGWTPIAPPVANAGGGALTLRGTADGRQRVLALTLVRLSDQRLLASMRSLEVSEPNAAATGR